VIVWVPIAVLAAAILARAFHVPGSVTWSVLFVLLIVLILAAPLPVAALAGLAGSIGLSADIFLRSLRAGMQDPVE
jgi:hypothetical protein